jgi:hypothetical protein
MGVKAFEGPRSIGTWPEPSRRTARAATRLPSEATEKVTDWSSPGARLTFDARPSCLARTSVRHAVMVDSSHRV